MQIASAGQAKLTVNDEREDDANIRRALGVLTANNYLFKWLIEEFHTGIPAGLTYCNGYAVPKSWENAVLVKVSDGAKDRESTHGLLVESTATQSGVK